MENTTASTVQDTASTGYPGGGGYPGTGDHPSILHYYLNVVRRYLWVILAVCLMVAAYGVIKAFRAPVRFRASARVLVERTTPRIMRYEGVQSDFGGWDPGFYVTQCELVKSRSVMERALTDGAIAPYFKTRPNAPPTSRSLLSQLRMTLIAALGGAPTAPPQPWERLRGQVRAEHVESTHFIELSSVSTDPKRAQAIVNGVAKAFVARHSEVKAADLGDAFAYLQRERDEQQAKLEAAEQELQAFRESVKDLALDVSTENQPAVKRLSALNDQLTSVQLRRNSLEAQLTIIGRALEKIARKEDGVASAAVRFSFPVVRDDAVLETLHGKLNAAQERLFEIQETYGPEHPVHMAAQGSVDAIREQFQVALNDAVEAKASALEILKVEEAELQRRYDDAHSEAVGLQNEAFTLNRLQNAVERHRRLLDDLVARMMEIDISSGYKKTNVLFSDHAALPTNPIGPNRMRTILVHLIVGFCLGIVLSFGIEHFDDTIHVPEDLRWPDRLPLLGFAPSIDVGKDMSALAARQQRSLISLNEPMSSAAEAYRHLRASLRYSLHERRLHVLSVLSCNPSEGKTQTVSNLAITLAQPEKPVLLIDADCHRPTIHHAFDLENDKGLSDVLTGNATLEEAVFDYSQVKPSAKGLHILSSGPQVDRPAELFMGDAFLSLIQKARETYEWVLIDTPPVLVMSDAVAISANCDGAIIVLRAGKTKRQTVGRLLQQLGSVHVSVVGVILNALQARRFGRKFSTYYRHGYTRYYRDYQYMYGERQPEEEHRE